MWKRFGQARSAGKLFNEAAEHWRRRQNFLLQGDDESAQKACADVVRLCQISIQSDQKEGDAYVLLANALLSAASEFSKYTNPDQHKFLWLNGAAVIQLWHSLPHRGYPITKNQAIGDGLWRITVDELKEEEGLTESEAINLMNSYKNRLATYAISPSSFEGIREIVCSKPLSTPFSSREATEEEETKPDVSKAEILEEIFRLEGTLRMSIRGGKHLSRAESNIITKKVSYARLQPWSRVFPVIEGASEDEINKWLNNPSMNVLLPDPIVMSMAAYTPVPVVTMERILKKLLQENYDMFWRQAEANVMSGRWSGSS